MTVLEAIQRSADFLAKKGVDNPRLQAELLLAHQLSLPRMQLYLNFERQLGAPEVDGLRELVKRRGRREPLQQITGSTSFCGLEIALNSHVLVPRPETELLAERGWQYLNGLMTPGEGAPLSGPLIALDFGAGSGCVAIALAAHCPGARVYGIDIAPSTLELARHNGLRHVPGDRLVWLAGDGFAALPAGILFDLIISNPPYIPSRELQTLEPEVRDFEPAQALDGGPDGLAFYRRFATESVPFLRAGGRLMLEFGDGQCELIRGILESQNWVVEAVQEDYTRRPRILVARRD